MKKPFIDFTGFLKSRHPGRDMMNTDNPLIDEAWALAIISTQIKFIAGRKAKKYSSLTPTYLTLMVMMKGLKDGVIFGPEAHRMLATIQGWMIAKGAMTFNEQQQINKDI